MTSVQSYKTPEMSDDELKSVYILLWPTWRRDIPFEWAFADFKKDILEGSAQAIAKKKGETGVRGGVRPRAHQFRHPFKRRLSSYSLLIQIQ